MKKLIAIAVLCISISACVIDDGGYSKRNSYHIEDITDVLYSGTVKNPAEILVNCMRVQDFINASDEERKSPLYSDIGYYPGTEQYVIKDWGMIETSGKNITDKGTVWKVSRSYFSDFNEYSSTVECLGGGEWAVSPDLSVFYNRRYTYESLSCSTVFTLAGEDSEGRDVWNCKVSGEYKEDSNYSVFFRNISDELAFEWIRTTTGSVITFSLECTGEFEADIYCDGSKIDWGVAYMNAGSPTYYMTSRD